MISRFPVTGELNIQNYQTFMEQSKQDFIDKWDKTFQYEETLSDFEFVHLLGTGTFGKVILAKFKIADTYYAIKAVEKQDIMKNNLCLNIKLEKKILQCINCPMTVHMDFFFKDNCYIYMVMPYIAGGELFGHIIKAGKFDEEQAKFVAGQIIIAIEYLHNLDIIHRDVKPENIILDDTGYVKLIDFGFCKQLTPSHRTYTLCGTPEYLAPEVIQNKGYGKPVDWWAIGILIYELMTGRSPFADRSTMRVYEKVTSGKYTMPVYFSKDLKDLIKRILQIDLTKRFGNLRNGVEDIKRHKWFRSLDWLALLNRKVNTALTPYQPLKAEKYKPVTLKTSCYELFAEEFNEF